MRLSLIGPGNVEFHYQELLKISKTKLESELEKIASIKMDDLNANSIDQAKEMIRGTAKSMGIEIKD